MRPPDPQQGRSSSLGAQPPPVRDRLLDVLNGRAVDRPPVICPGGMMSAATADLIGRVTSPHNLAAHHFDPEVMARLALAIHEETGFENLGVPFCMTVEAEALGSTIELGDARLEPRVVEYAAERPELLFESAVPDSRSAGRMPVVLAAIERLKHARTGLPVIGNVTGPFSLAASVVGPMTVLRLVRRDPARVDRLLGHAADTILAFARRQIEAGADIIAIADPTATGDILGADSFRRVVKPHLQRIIGSLRPAVPVILHICGDATQLVPDLCELGASALSFDAPVRMDEVWQALSRIGRAGTVLMGNASTYLLHKSSPAKVMTAARRVAASGVVGVVAPACGLSTQTPLENLQAFTEAVKRGGEPWTPANG